MESSKPDLIEVGRNIRDAFGVEDDETEALRAGRVRLLDHVAAKNLMRERRRGATSRRVLAAFLATASVTAAVVIWLRLPLSFLVGTAPGRVGDLIEASGAAVGLRFSEGSSILVQSGARMRVLAAERSGARVLVENGPLDVAIVHQRRHATHWRFEAGPMAVLVTGTKFRVDWNEKEQAFALDMREGSVVVSGGCLQGTRTVLAGDSMRLSCRTTVATARSTEPASGPAGAAAAARVPARHVAAHAATTSDDWQQLIASGRYEDGLRLVDRIGFSKVCQSAGDSALLALADAARLSGRTARAQEALTTLRRRFPGSLSAATAAFALGRIAFERHGDYEDAARWFGTYLDEQPSGPLMGDATGRLMEARHRAGDRVSARRDAERYLQRFPGGPYAATASAILAD
jgi:transmembrane sensor